MHSISLNWTYPNSRLYIFTAYRHASRATVMRQRPVGLDMDLSQPNLRPVPPKKNSLSDERYFREILR